MPLQNRVLPTQEIVAEDGRGLLMGNRGTLGWSWEGYVTPIEPPGHRQVVVLTPPANLVVLKAGFAPLLHPSAFGN